MPIPERPDRRQLTAGVVVLVAAVVLEFVHAGPVLSLIGIVLILVGSVLRLRAMGWVFSRRG